MAHAFLHPFQAWRHYRTVKRRLAEIAGSASPFRPNVWLAATPVRR
jgi:hypothetical protein